MIRVLLVDDQLTVRRNLRKALELEPNILVAAEAASGNAAIAVARRSEIDLVLMDVRMPDGDGISTAQAFAAQSPPLPTVIMTAFDIDDSLFKAMEAGASGFVLKTGPLRELIRAIRSAARGELVISSDLTRRVISQTISTRIERAKDPRWLQLTSREIEVVRGLCTGTSTNEAIGGRLGLSPMTVKSHIQRIITKIGVGSRAELVAWAFRQGIVS